MSDRNEELRKERRATIGASVAVKGEISGNEDILIEGSVEGVINLKENAVTVAKGGVVKANIFGVTIHVEGEVTGDLYGTEKVILHKTGRVIGNVLSPSVSIEDGAKIKGTVDTESAPAPVAGHTSLRREIKTEREETAQERPAAMPPSAGQGKQAPATATATSKQ